MTVAVTLPLFVDFVELIGGDNVEVFSLIPEGADPHTYEFTAEDVQRMAGVDFFFVNRLGLDDRLQPVIEENRDEDAKVIPFAPNIRSPRGSELDDPDLTAEEAGDDAHLWLDPTLARVYAEIAADTFIIYDGINEAFYKNNFQAYRERTLELDGEISAALAGIPAERRRLFTFHDAFSLFALRYGVEVAGFLAPDPQPDATPAEIERAAAAARDSGAPAVFAERGFASEAMEEVASAAGVELCSLYSDMPDEEAPTYLEMMRANLRELVRCLGE